MNNRTMKRLLAIVLAFTMMWGMCINVFAAPAYEDTMPDFGNAKTHEEALNEATDLMDWIEGLNVSTLESFEEVNINSLQEGYWIQDSLMSSVNRAYGYLADGCAQCNDSTANMGENEICEYIYDYEDFVSIITDAFLSELRYSNGSMYEVEDETGSGNELGSGDTSSYIGVSELGWDAEEPWIAKFKINDSTPGIYKVYVYFNGSCINWMTLGDLSEYCGENFYCNFNTEMNNTGDYTFQVEILNKDNTNIVDYVSEMSNVFHYQRAETSLGYATNLQWDSEREGVARWDSVENAQAYRVDLYNENDNIFGEYIIVTRDFVPECDFSDYINNSGNYRFKVQAISRDMLNYAHGEWSEFSGYYEKAETNEPEEDDTVSGNEPGSGDTSDIRVSELGWNTAEPWVIKFKINDATPGIYSVELYRDGTAIHTVKYNFDISQYSGKYWYDNLNTIIEETGDYTYRVKFSYNDNEDVWDFSTGCVSEMSEVFHYERPEIALGTATNLRWDSEREGVAKWDPVENAESYRVWLYDEDEMVIGYYNYNPSVMECDFLEHLGDSGQYRFQVQAISKNILECANGEWSDYSGYYKTNEIKKEEVNNILDNSEATATEKVSSLISDENITKDTLQALIQTETDIQEKIEDLESAYITEKNITQNDPVVDETIMDPNKVSILGASLNATEGATVDFNISLPDEEDKALINTDLYKSVLAFEMSLEGDGINSSDLDIPVCITLPIPEGMNANNLKILHYSTAGAEPVIYDRSNIRLNGDGTFSFTITHFSMFAIVEVEETQNNVPTQVVSSKGRKQTVVKGWEPTTPDEKKRYAVVGKETVEYAADKANTYDVAIFNSMQGPLCFNSFEAVLGDFTIGRTYNILPNKKMAYTMSDSAKITLTIPNALRKDGRVFKMICVTENGAPYVLNDLDNNPNTITFSTNKFYAFALIYK